MKKAKVYIDGANIFYTQKKLGWIFDWVKIRKLIESEIEVIEWRYYVGVKKDDEKILGYLKYLDKIGFNLSTKPLKKIKINNNEFIYKANLDVEMAVDILLDKSKYDELIIFSGDSDFQYLVKKLKDVGKKIKVISSRKTLSWELKLEANQIIYFENIRKKIER